VKFKRFIVLMDEQYYPSAGMGSAVASFDTLEEAVAQAESRNDPDADYFHADYVEVFDCEAREVVWEAD
jgi:hypothetical protein